MVKPAAGALVIAMIALLAGCVAGQDGGPTRTAKATPETRILIPLTTLVSARLVPAADRSGAPLPASGAAPLTPLIHPAATALFAGDLYIADSGAGRIYRYDRALNVMTVVGGVTASPGMRMAAGADASLYVLDMPQRRVTRFGRGGQVLATYADARNLGRPIAFAVDEARGELLVADELFRQLVAFHPLGGARRLLSLRMDERHRVMSITAMAVSREGLQISDALCRCIAVVDRDGTVRDTYGHQDLAQPGAIAVDRFDRVYVADVFDRSIKMFSGGRMIASIPASEVGALEVSDLSINESNLLLADGAGARVIVLRIVPPAGK